jgi:hypothetical protein
MVRLPVGEGNGAGACFSHLRRLRYLLGHTMPKVFLVQGGCPHSPNQWRRTSSLSWHPALGRSISRRRLLSPLRPCMRRMRWHHAHITAEAAVRTDTDTWWWPKELSEARTHSKGLHPSILSEMSVASCTHNSSVMSQFWGGLHECHKYWQQQ